MNLLDTTIDVTTRPAVMAVNTKVTEQLQEQPLAASSNGNNDSFNFELWAKEVRPQLVAALQRRARRSNQ